MWTRPAAAAAAALSLLVATRIRPIKASEASQRLRRPEVVADDRVFRSTEERELHFLRNIVQSDNTNNSSNSSAICPPPGFDALKDFDFDSFISARWYVQKQIPVAYQTRDQFYCVTADYTKDRSYCFLCNRKPRVDIDNRARQGSVTGAAIGGPRRFFRGIVSHPAADPAKVTVSAFLAPLLPRSNYWVVAAGTYDGVLSNNNTATTSGAVVYEWAIITGAAPTKIGANGKCRPDPGVSNFRGMWMFARDPVLAPGIVDAIDRAAGALGLDTTAWLPVAQEGCVYDY